MRCRRAARQQSPGSFLTLLKLWAESRGETAVKSPCTALCWCCPSSRNCVGCGPAWRSAMLWRVGLHCTGSQMAGWRQSTSLANNNTMSHSILGIQQFNSASF